MLARPDFAKALRGFDPRTLHTHPPTAASLRTRLASLGNTSGGGSSGGSGSGRQDGGSTTRQALMRARGQLSQRGGVAPSSSSAVGGAGGVAQAMMLAVAVRSGGRAIGALYLWCARVLAQAEDLKEEEALEMVREEESGHLAGVMEQAQGALDEAELRMAEAQEGSGSCERAAFV